MKGMWGARKVLLVVVVAVVVVAAYLSLLLYRHENGTTFYAPLTSFPTLLNAITTTAASTTTTTTTAAASTTITSDVTTTANNGRVPWWREVVCTRGSHGTDKVGEPLKHVFRNVTPERDSNIFLMDTSCNPSPSYRAWCSVESWARNNPDRQVWFLLTSDGMEKGKLPSTLLKKYMNLQVVGADLNDLFRDTPLLPLFDSGKWTKEDTWPVELLSDMLRVLMLWRWGGLYSDTDVISVRPYTLPLNALGFESVNVLGSAFYSFRARHPLLLELMTDMSKNFQPKYWGSIGPSAISRVMQKTCRKALPELLPEAPVMCPGNITLYSMDTFYPIYYPSSDEFFKPGGGKHFDEMFRDTFTLHFWNKITKKKLVKVNESSIYEVAAQRFCPLTYHIATTHSDVF